MYTAYIFRCVYAAFFIGIPMFPEFVVAQCPTLVWSDEFDGNSLDVSKWEVQLGDGCAINLCGWGNNELQYYQAQNATVSEGTLEITAKREQVGGKQYTSARIRTKNLGDWTYGRFEARMKLPTSRGMWPAFWMLPTDEVYGGWPQSGEIDIMELIGSEPATVVGTVHYGNPWPQNQFKGGDFKLLEGIFNDEFHTFAIEWEQNEIRWYVDDYLYSRMVPANLQPFRWPFDQDFHILLNLAVGGNFPGNPDATSIFPQNLEVDYVRVYGGNFATLTGNRFIANDAGAQAYSLLNTPEGSTIQWTVPEGANIISGQGTSSIQVDFGEMGGEIKVEISNDCETKTLTLGVEVEPPFGPEFFFINYDDPDNISFNFTTGEYTPNTDNPGSDAVNSSQLSAKYVRNGAEQFDILVFDVDKITDAKPYVENEKKFFVDIYTSAPKGTKVLLQLENKFTAQPTNFPVGRHSRFEGVINEQNTWERIELKFLDQPDSSVPNTSISQLIFLFASNTLTSNTFYLDNFASYAPQEPVSIRRNTFEKLAVELFPNPGQDRFTLLLPETVKGARLEVIDQLGRIVLTKSFQKETQVSLSNLAKGAYVLRVVSGKKQSTKRIVRQ